MKTIETKGGGITETEIIRRRVRHWKTTIAGVGFLLAPVALAVWPEHSGLIGKLYYGLTGAAFIAAADAKKE